MVTKARGAKSRSNLKRGGGKGRGGRPSESARRMALKLLSRPKYRKTLQEKLDNCTLHPSVHSLLLQYGYGRPKEIIETQGALFTVSDYHAPIVGGTIMTVRVAPPGGGSWLAETEVHS
jgi:hypothetical protein